jgi:hypothetical protein
MTFSGNNGSGQHFRGRYAPASGPTVAQPVPEGRSLPVSEPPQQAGDPPRPAAIPAAQAPAPTLHAVPLVAVGLLAGAVALVAVLSANRSPTQTPLSWQASCGSPPVSGSSWWPVLGPA